MRTITKTNTAKMNKPTTKGLIPKVLANLARNAAKDQEFTHASYEKGPWDKGHWANRK